MEIQKKIDHKFQSELSPNELKWVHNKLDEPLSGRTVAFVMAHRFVSHDPVSGGRIPVRDTSYTIDLSQWSKDQLARTIILLSLDEGQENKFHAEIEKLFKTADNRESQALYAAIPLFNYEDTWVHRATEAIRSNVGLIFDAMAFNNPYPALHFNENAWNQLVLKTIFSDKPIGRITGLKERRNHQLANAISDFAHERWAAGRTLSPDIWFLTEPFPGEIFWQDVQVLLNSDQPGNKEAGYLLSKAQSVVPEHIEEDNRKLFLKLDKKEVTWSNIPSGEPVT